MAKIKKPKTSRLIEVVVRVIAIITCSGAVVAAGFSVAKYRDIENHQLSDAIIGVIDVLSPDVRKMTQAVVAVAIVSGIFIPLEIVVILLRLLGISLGKLGRVIVILDLLLILLAAGGFGVAGVLGAITAKDWSEDVVDNLPTSIAFVPQAFVDFFTADVRALRVDVAATAACSLLACGSCALLLVFVIVTLVKHNRLDYTSA